MATNKSVSREEVKTLAVAVGVREAARQTGINENTILSWSKRDQWFTDPPKPLTVHAKNRTAINAITTPSDALRSSLQERSGNTKLALSKAALKASEHLAESDPPAIIKSARAMRDIASTASTVHGWESGSRDTGPFNPQSIQILSQRTYLSLPGNTEQQGE